MSCVTFASTSAGCDAFGVRGDGVAESRWMRLAQRFHGVRNEGPVDLEIVNSDAVEEKDGNVRVRGDRNLLDEVSFTVEAGMLVVTLRRPVRPTIPLGAHIVVKDLDIVESSGSGDVRVIGEPIPSLRLVVRGSGSTTTEPDIANVQVDARGSGTVRIAATSPLLEAQDPVRIETTGSGDVEIHGMAEEAILTSTGSGDIDAASLRVKRATASTLGSGDVHVCATDALTVRQRGSGDVLAEHCGHPRVVASRTGSGVLVWRSTTR